MIAMADAERWPLGGQDQEARRALQLTCMANLLASTEERVYFKDIESRFLLVSVGWAAAYAPGRDPAELAGKTDFDIFSEDHAANAYADEQRIIRTGEPVVQKVELETYWGRRDAWVSTTKLPLRDERGRIIGTYGISRDITAQIRAENDIARQAQQLSYQNEELRKVARMKDEFIGRLSAELRVPLSSVVRYLSMLREQHTRELAGNPILAVLERNARQLQRMVDDLLLLPRIQTGTLPIQTRTADLAGIAAGAVEEARRDARVKHIDLTFSGAPVPRFAIDPVRIGHLLGNLISNAVKYTDAGGKVEVKLGLADGQAVVTVTDTGAGIPAASLAAISGLLSGSATAQAVPGVAGLGLTISKAIVDAHHGTITVDSREGQGSAFTVRLPVRQQPADAGDQPDPGDQPDGAGDAR
jgi:two-component system, sensor histidine kinase and response regulator